MNVNITSPYLKRIREIISDQHGFLSTSDLSSQGIPRTYLSILEDKGEIQRVSRGVYSSRNAIADEMAGLQVRFKGAIFSHETSLYLHGLTDRTPLFYSVTVPAGYNATSLKQARAKVYFVKPDLYPLGMILTKSPHHNDLKAYNLERTVCDILRNRSRIDVQLISEALKRYVSKADRDINLLYRYAGLFSIQKIVRFYIEVLL
jgi:predicted transcriptional regulator of viral defense system